MINENSLLDVNQCYWWKEYNDDTLNTIIYLALKNNKDIHTNFENLKKFLYQTYKLSSGRLPDGTVDGRYDNRYFSDETNTTYFEKNFSFSGILSYELDLFNKADTAKKAMYYNYLSQAEIYYYMQLIVINNIVENYMKICCYNSLLRILNEKMSFLEKLLNIEHIKFTSGKDMPLNFIKIKKNIQELNEQINNYDIERNNTIKNIINIINLSDSNKLPLITKKLEDFKYIKIDKKMNINMLNSRPDIKAAKYKIENAFYNKELAQKALLPSIMLEAGIHMESNSELPNIFLPLYVANINIRLPFLNWNKLKWDIKISESELNIMKNEFTYLLNSAINEVNFLWIDYESYNNLKNILSNKLKIQNELKNIYKVRYENGAEEISNYLEANIELLDIELNLINTCYNLLKTNILIIKSLGIIKNDK